MKKHILLLPIITMLISGLAFFAKPQAKQVAADSSNHHLFIQVEREEDLEVGDTIFLGTLGGTVFSALSGNPVFASESHVSGRSEDGKKYWTLYGDSYQEMLLMKVEKGAYDNTWSFKSLRSASQEEDYAHPTRGRYLAYGHNYSDKKYHDIQAYGDVNMADNKGQYTSWTVEFRGDEHYAIMKYYDEQYDTHIQWAYYGRTARNNFGYYTGKTDICIFKEITLDQSRVTLDIFSHPDQTTVYEGDYLDLTGLEMQVTIDKGEDNEISFRASYETEPTFFNVYFAAHAATHVYCTYVGWNFNLEVEVIEDTSDYIYFNELKAQRSDYRGTYLVVYQDGTTIQQLRADGWTFEYQKASVDGPIHDAMNQSIMMNRFFITRLRIDGTSYMFLQAGKNNKYVIRDGNEIDFTDDVSSVTTASAITIDENCSVHMGDAILYYAYNQFHLSSNPDASSRAKLYKRVVDYTEFDSENTTRYTDFINSFASTSSAGCDVSGDSDTTITTAQWNTLKSKFDNVANDIWGYDLQGYLANMTYIHNEEKGTNSVKDLIDRYDYILAKYQDTTNFDDFIDRKINPAYQDNYHQPVNSGFIQGSSKPDSKTVTIVIFAISMTSTISLTALLVFKKKRIH